MAERLLEQFVPCVLAMAGNGQYKFHTKAIQTMVGRVMRLYRVIDRYAGEHSLLASMLLTGDEGALFHAHDHSLFILVATSKLALAQMNVAMSPPAYVNDVPLAAKHLRALLLTAAEQAPTGEQGDGGRHLLVGGGHGEAVMGEGEYHLRFGPAGAAGGQQERAQRWQEQQRARRWQEMQRTQVGDTGGSRGAQADGVWRFALSQRVGREVGRLTGLDPQQLRSQMLSSEMQLAIRRLHQMTDPSAPQRTAVFRDRPAVMHNSLQMTRMLTCARTMPAELLLQCYGDCTVEEEPGEEKKGGMPGRPERVEITW
jgi:hypothetical protein